MQLVKPGMVKTNTRVFRLPKGSGLAFAVLLGLSIGASTQASAFDIAANAPRDRKDHGREQVSFGLTQEVFATTQSVSGDFPDQAPAATVAPPHIARLGITVLSPRDADLYTRIFTAQRAGKPAEADQLIEELGDRALVGHVLAARYLSQSRPGAAALREWLTQYSDLPQADAIYAKARKLRTKTDALPHRPALTPPLRSGYDEGRSNFTAEISLPENRALSSGDIMLTGRVNGLLRQGSPSQALTVLEHTLHERATTHQAPVDTATLQDARAAIAAGFFYAGDATQALTQARMASNRPLAQWIGGLAAWRLRDFISAEAMLSQLALAKDLSAWDESAASYWTYRSRQRTGDRKGAMAMLVKAAENPRTFYGLLATHLLKRDLPLSWQAPTLTETHLTRLAEIPAGWRAMALIQIGERDLAKTELERLRPQGNRNLQEALLALANEAGLPGLAINLGGMVTDDKGKTYDAARYPLPPWQPDQGFTTDRALLFAVMRQESRFDPTASSYRGAQGLMQLMPRTASLMVKKDEKIDAGRLADPVINLTLGQRYVSHLAAQPDIGDNLLLLLAAYNSGPGTLARWRQDTGARQDDPLLFLESMPIRETRDYVEQVLTNYWIYGHRLNQSKQSLTQITEGRWPRAITGDTQLAEAAPTQSMAQPAAERPAPVPLPLESAARVAMLAMPGQQESKEDLVLISTRQTSGRSFRRSLTDSNLALQWDIRALTPHRPSRNMPSRRHTASSFGKEVIRPADMASGPSERLAFMAA